jgi:hypothetical protein
LALGGTSWLGYELLPLKSPSVDSAHHPCSTRHLDLGTATQTALDPAADAAALAHEIVGKE